LGAERTASRTKLLCFVLIIHFLNFSMRWSVSETINIAEIAAKISKDIFGHFLWRNHPAKDDNFPCSNPKHIGEGGKPKKTHPADVVFYYDDPYLGSTIYLHTDLKSYEKDSITPTKLKGALKSLCFTTECAKDSQDWRIKYSVNSGDLHDVRGMLFIHNHDNGYERCFLDAIEKVNFQSLPVAPNTYVHFLGPQDIQRLYSIGNDLIRLNYSGDLSPKYTFYYPDLVMWRRLGDVWDQPATIESLTGPYLIIKHEATKTVEAGYLIYYNQPGASVEEFEYFIDSLSRFQMLDSAVKIRIRVTAQNPDKNLRSIFHAAKKKYAKAWGFDPHREEILNRIEIDQITSVTSTYNPGKMGWRE
jgi:hypothetical protein